MYYVYILRTSNNQLYIGQTNNLNRREIEHRHFHHGAKYIKDSKSDFEIVFNEEHENRTSAMKREKQIKGWSRAKKEALIINDIELLKKL